MHERPKLTAEETARNRAIAILAAEPNGISKSELRRRIGGNAGAFRRLFQRMVDTGVIETHMEERADCGPTRVCTLKHRANAA